MEMRYVSKQCLSNFSIFYLFYFLKMSPIFVGSVHNFGRSDDDLTEAGAYPQLPTQPNFF